MTPLRTMARQCTLIVLRYHGPTLCQSIVSQHHSSLNSILLVMHSYDIHRRPAVHLASTDLTSAAKDRLPDRLRARVCCNHDDASGTECADLGPIMQHIQYIQ